MELILYKDFGKRKNSTKQPDASVQSVTKQVRLKQGTSVLSPTFLLSDPDPNYNYCKWRWRYYYITDIVLNNDNVYEIQCEVDPMASWKNNIGASQQYVTRSSTSFDGTIPDTTYPAKTVPSYEVRTSLTQLGWAADANEGTYIVGLNGDATPFGTAVTTGGTYYAVLTPGQAKALSDILNKPSQFTFLDEDGFTENLGRDRYNFNPIQFVRSIKWFPFTLAAGTEYTQLSGLDYLACGWFTLPISGPGILNSRNRIFGNSFIIPKHPLAATRGAYLNRGQWAEYILSFPPFGDIVLDSDIVGNESAMTYECYIDFITGAARLSIFAGSQYVTSAETQLGVDMPLSQVTRNEWGRMTSAVSGIAGVALGAATKNVGSAISGLSNIASAFTDRYPTQSTTGSVGSMITPAYLANHQPFLRATFFSPVDEDLADRGRPLCQNKVINTLPGFLQCSDVHIGWQAMPAEKDTITSFMESGFFYE